MDFNLVDYRDPAESAGALLHMNFSAEELEEDKEQCSATLTFNKSCKTLPTIVVTCTLPKYHTEMHEGMNGDNKCRWCT